MNLPANLNRKALLVLAVFCGMVALQATCTAGLLPHCDHPDVAVHDEDPCPQDHCRDNFSLPLKSDSPAQATIARALLSVDRYFEPATCLTDLQPDKTTCDPFPSRPSGHFPLLI